MNIVEVGIKGLLVDKQSSTTGAWGSPWALWWHLYVDSGRTHGLGGWIDSDPRGWAGMRTITAIMGCNVNALRKYVPLFIYILALPHVPPYVCMNWLWLFGQISWFVCRYGVDVISYLHWEIEWVLGLLAL